MSFLEKYNTLNENQRDFSGMVKGFLVENNINDVGIKEMAILEALGEKTMPVGRLTVIVPAIGNPCFSLKKLEKKGYIEKELASHDDRVRLIKATEKGQSLARMLKKNNKNLQN